MVQTLGQAFTDEDDSAPAPMILSASDTLVREPPAPHVARKVNEFYTDAGTRVWIVLEENDAIPPTGQFIGVNGRGYMLRPGEPAYVPMGVINALNDAIESRPDIDPITKQVMGYKTRLRLPYRLVTAPANAR